MTLFDYRLADGTTGSLDAVDEQGVRDAIATGAQPGTVVAVTPRAAGNAPVWLQSPDGTWYQLRAGNQEALGLEAVTP